MISSRKTKRTPSLSSDNEEKNDTQPKKIQTGNNSSSKTNN